MIKDIPGIPGYRADDQGVIYSKSGRRLRGTPNQKGYVRVAIRAPGLPTCASVHSLILRTFVGERPNGMVARHLNGNPADNRATNLKWGTPHENTIDKQRHGTIARGERNGQSKLTEDQAKWIVANKGKMTKTDMARALSVSRRAVAFVMSGENWSYLNSAAMAQESGE